MEKPYDIVQKDPLRLRNLPNQVAKPKVSNYTREILYGFLSK